MPRGPRAVARRRGVPPWLPVVAALVVCGALVVTVSVIADDGGDGDETATTSTTANTGPTITTTVSPTTDPPPEPIPLHALRAEPLPESVPRSYRIAYDVVENGLARQETWTVRRPYEALVVSMRDGEIVSGAATSRTNLWNYLDDRDGWYPVQPQLHRAAFDLRPLPVMATMLELGYAEEIGEAEYAGRACRVFRVAEPLSSGSLSPLGGSEETEVCIDGSGLVVHERWRIDGNDVTERTATSVEIDPPVDPATFEPEPRLEAVPELDALLATIAVEADEETVERLRTDVALPEGFILDSTVFRASTSDSAGTAGEIVRFHSDGPDLVELAEIEVTSTAADLRGGSARPIEVEGFDEVWFDLDFRASTIRARIDDASFLELRGPDPARLLDLLLTVTLR